MSAHHWNTGAGDTFVQYEEIATSSPIVQLRQRPSPKVVIADYLERVHPARRHGATDCGENLTGQCDADHMIQWLAERGLALVRSKP